MLRQLRAVAANEVSTKMENSQVTATKVEEPAQVTLKDPRKVAAGKRLVKYNCRKKEELAQKSKAQDSETKLTLSQACGIGAVIAVGVLGLLDYYVYQSRKKIPQRMPPR